MMRLVLPDEWSAVGLWGPVLLMPRLVSGFDVSSRRGQTLSDVVLKGCNLLLTQGQIPCFVSQTLKTSLRGLIAVEIRSRRMLPIGLCHLPVVLFFLSTALCLLAEVLRQLVMAFRSIRSVEQPGHLLPSQMYRWVCCSGA